MERTYKLLIIEPDAAWRDRLQAFFTQHGFDVHTASDGEDGLRQLRDDEFDVAIIELQLPRVAGLEIAGTALKEGIDTSILVLTAHGDYAKAIQGYRVGIEDWFDKSNVDLEELLERVVNYAHVIPLDEIPKLTSAIPDKD